MNWDRTSHLRWVLYQEMVKKQQEGFISFISGSWIHDLSAKNIIHHTLSDENFNLRIKIQHCNYSWKKKIYFENKKKVGLPKDTCLWQTSGSNSSIFLSISDLQMLWACGCQTSLRNFHSSSILNLYTVSVITFGCSPFGLCLTKNISQSLSVLHELDIFEKLRELVLDTVWVSVLW